MKLSKLRQKIYHIEFDSQYKLTSSFLRLQEFYESPNPDFRGKFFSSEQYMDWYASQNPSGEFSYFTDWSGFNVPDWAIRQFNGVYKRKGSMLKKEIYLLDLIGTIPQWKTQQNFYLIATYKRNNSVARKKQKKDILHEIAHAYWYLYQTYRNTMFDFMEEKMSPKAVQRMHQSLKDMGYDDSVLMDETQAYMATSDKFFLQRNLNYQHKMCRFISKYFKEFDKQKLLKGNK